MAEHKVITEDSDEAREIWDKSRFGKIIENKVHLSLIEAYYLWKKDKIDIVYETGRSITDKGFLTKAKKTEPNFLVRYYIFKDMRDRGYIIKTALKFGADFRVYDRGVKPGEDHAKWIIFPVHESEMLTWYDFSAKNRVAHSTRKRLMMGVVDDEGDVTYWEVKWVRP